MAWRRTTRLSNGVALTSKVSHDVLNATSEPWVENMEGRRLRRIFKYTSLICLLVGLLAIVWSTHPPVQAGAWTIGVIVVAAPLYIMTVGVVRILLGYYIVYVQQKPGATQIEVASRKRPGWRWVNKTAITLLCAYLPYAGVLLQDDLSWFIMGACAVTVYCTFIPPSPALRPLVPRLELGLNAIAVIGLPVAIYRIVYLSNTRIIYLSNTRGDTTLGSDEKYEAISEFFIVILGWLARFMLIFLEAMPVILLCFCLRLDMRLHFSSTASTSADVYASYISATDAGLRPKTPVSLQESLALHNSTVVPVNLPPFKKLYFRTAFAACAVATLTTAVFAPFDFIPHTHDKLDGPIWNILYRMMAMEAALISILGSILFTAWYKR